MIVRKCSGVTLTGDAFAKLGIINDESLFDPTAANFALSRSNERKVVNILIIAFPRFESISKRSLYNRQKLMCKAFNEYRSCLKNVNYFCVLKWL